MLIAKTSLPTFFLAVLLMATSAPGVVVIDEDFSDDDGGCVWTANYGCAPQNVGKAGQWLPSGHIAGGGAHTPNMDNDWAPNTQSQVGQPNTGDGWSGLPSLGFNATLNRQGADTGEIGVFNMDGIIKFQTADGTDRPAVTGELIRGSFRIFRQNGNFGFGFTDNIAELQAFQATMPTWNVGSAPVMMPTPYTTGKWESETQNPNYDPAYRGFSPNVTGHISLNNGANKVFINAPVDMDNDGVVDFGTRAPKVDPENMIGRLNTSTPSTIRFEYTVGNAAYDLLQIDQGNGWEDIVQCNSLDCQADPGGLWGAMVPDPGGPMPVGHVFESIEAMFITVGNYQLTEGWADDFFVEIPSPMAGDYNENGVVDAADYTIYQDNVGNIVDFPNRDSGLLGTPVGADDYTVWKNSFGAAGSGSGAAVPEPGTGVLLLLGFGLAAVLRGFKRGVLSEG